jgi:MIP family channel proteins
MYVRLGAEAVGTLVLVYFGCAALINGASGLLGASVAFALALAAAIWIVGPVSGGHFNPSVSLAAALRGRLSWIDAGLYAAAQLVGGFVGALLLWATYGQDGVAAGLGATRIAESASSGAGLVGALLAEALATFLLVAVVLAVAGRDAAVDEATPADRRTAGIGPGLAIGSMVAIGMLAIGAITGASMNFARTFGPDLTLALAGGTTAWSDIWVYLLGPAIGAAGAAYAYDPVTRLVPTSRAR